MAVLLQMSKRARASKTYNLVGVYTGSAGVTVDSQWVAGEWVQLQLPVSLNVTYYTPDCKA